jgi:integrase
MLSTTESARCAATPETTPVSPDTLPSAIDSTAKGEKVARRRFQRGSVYPNKAKTVWLGAYSEYVLSSTGVEERKRREIILCPVRKPNSELATKREVRRLLQPYVDRVNASISSPAREHKSVTFEAFAAIWERDYLCLSKPSTQATMRGQVKQLNQFFGSTDMRRIGAGELQRLIAKMEAGGYDPKTIRNMWVVVRLIWDAALAQGYVDRIIPKPKLPRAVRKKPRYFRLDDVAKIIAHSGGDIRVFCWLAAESGPRGGELCAMLLSDVTKESVTINHSIWNGKIGTPKTPNSVRTIAVSPQLAKLLSEQIARQQAKGHRFLFTTSTGSPWDINLFRQRKLKPLLAALGIEPAGLHAFRHFNASLLGSLRTPLKTIQDRLGHALTGSLTLDVYTHAEPKENVEAATLAGAEIEKAVNSVRLTTVKAKGLPRLISEALVA